MSDTSGSNLYVCKESRQLYLMGEMDDYDSGLGVTNGLYKLARAGDGPIRLIINSPGGELLAGHSLYQSLMEVRSEGITIEAHVRGQACSAAIFPLLACNVKYAPPGSIIMVHGLRAFQGGDLRTHEADRLINMKMVKWAAALLEAHTKHAAKYWEKILQDDTPIYYTAEEALEEGLLDAIT